MFKYGFEAKGEEGFRFNNSFYFRTSTAKEKKRAHNNMIDSILLMEKREKNSVI